MQPVSTTARVLLIACLALIGAACSNQAKQAENLQPDKLYERANRLMLGGDYRGAVRYYEALEAGYPFSAQSRQGRLDIIYAYYKAREAESAVDAADQFIRENSTHPRVDYAMYVKGLTYFERSPNFLERWFNTDLTERPPQDVRRAFDAFDQLIKQSPNSIYAHDARQRMVFLRNRLADYEVYVADLYFSKLCRLHISSAIPSSSWTKRAYSMARKSAVRNSAGSCSTAGIGTFRSSPLRTGRWSSAG